MSDDSLEDSNYLTQYEKSIMDKINSNIHHLQLHLNETQNNLKGTNTRNIYQQTLEGKSNTKGTANNLLRWQQLTNRNAQPS
jgi:NADPH-dependent 7-cyano-7-deazaguanine reductase QueF-like protein